MEKEKLSNNQRNKMLSTARNARKNLRFENPKSVFYKREVKKITTTAEIITLADIRHAAARIAPYIKRTPLFYDEDLSARFDSNFYLKHELLQKTGAFKVRGAFNKLLSLSEAERRRRRHGSMACRGPVILASA